MRFFGERSGLSPELQRLMAAAEEKSTHYDGCQMNLCINYGGRDEILHAVRQYAEAYKAGTAPELTEDVFSSYLYSAGIPDPDLIIRTSGEQRLSNFLPWQGAYSGCISPTCSGRTLPSATWTRPWRSSSGATGALAA